MSYIVNDSGAKVFTDISKQPKLVLCDGSTVKTVLSVGLIGAQTPVANIRENDEVVCYILPDWFEDWCYTCMGMASLGVDMFPADVKFEKHGNEYAVNIL